PGDDALLERHDETLAPRLVEDQLPVERLREASVDHPDRPALLGQRIGALERAHHDRAEADEEQVVALAQDLCLTDRDRPRLDGWQPEAGIARVVQRERMLLLERRVQERAQLLLVLRTGHDQVPQAALRRARHTSLVRTA